MNTATAPHNKRPKGGSQSSTRWLGKYTDPDSGHTREILCLPGSAGSRLVVDRPVDVHAAPLLIAHLAPDEPEENARIVAEMYLADANIGHCRRIAADDLRSNPLDSSASTAESDGCADAEVELLDSAGAIYRLQLLRGRRSLPELRWTRSCPSGQDGLLTLREVIERLEDYEPAHISATALARHREDRHLSTFELGRELERVRNSQMVLNRGLREAVEREVARGASISQIAMRCDRIKKDPRGSESGETSWLARRIGQNAESGKDEPNRWVHTDVLALIARQGLGTCPSEVEL
jgi:hypothetical protein